jgi:protoporphyrinogen IX oxidase
VNLYDVLRGLHILAIIAWMAGLLYLPRLFVYHLKHFDQPEITQVFVTMEANLYRIIMNPAMIVSWCLGLSLIYVNISQRWGLKLLWEPWFIVKMAGVIGISFYHLYLGRSLKKLARYEAVGSEKYWRKINEIPFVLAIIMVLSVTTEFLSL